MVGAAADGCDTKSIVGASFHTDSWFWPGNFDFTALDSSLSNFFACAGHNAVAVSYGSILDGKIDTSHQELTYLCIYTASQRSLTTCLCIL